VYLPRAGYLPRPFHPPLFHHPNDDGDDDDNNNNNNLIIEIQRMWNMKCFVIPVIIGATGIVSKTLQKYLETIPGQHSIDSLQKKLPY
jgi:hypothetical protein